MRIGMISGHACIRVSKMALPLMDLGHTVHLVAKKVPPYHESFATFNLCADPYQYGEAIKLLAPNVDLFHVHNEPSWYVTLIKELTDKPVLLDVHDTFLTRMTDQEFNEKAEAGKYAPRIFIEERNNFQAADALNFVSEPVRDIVVDEYQITAPTYVLPSYVPRNFYQYIGREWLGGLVYEGKVNMPEQNVGSFSGFTYCDYTRVADEAQDVGMDFHIYPGKHDRKFVQYYSEQRNAYVHEPLRYDMLLDHLTRHDWGLVGNAYHTPQWEKTAPNKLFEYLAASVPVAAMNAKWCEEFVQANEVGMSVQSVEELAGRWKEHRKLRERVLKRRQDFAMERHIGGLVKFYEAIL